MRNPFQYGSVVSADAFCNRLSEMSEIRRAVENCQKIFIYSERRVGKTSLVRRALEELPKDYVVVFVDLWPTDDVDDFTIRYAKALADAFSPTHEKFSNFAKSAFSVLKPTMTLDESGQPRFEFGAITPKAEVASLDDALEAPARIMQKYERKVVVVFDEFQQVLEYESDHVERQLRSVIQNHKDIPYIFLGSRKHLIKKMVLDSSRPLYKAGSHLPLGSIANEHWIPFIQKKFDRTKKFINESVIKALLEVTQGHPFYTQHLCHALWEIHGTSDSGLDSDPSSMVTNDLVRASELVIDREDHAYSAIWGALSTNQRRFLEALTEEDIDGNYIEHEVFSSEFLLKSELKSPSSVQRVINALLDKDIIDQDVETFFITDRFFRFWIRRKTNSRR